MGLFSKLVRGSTVTLAEHGIKIALMFVVTPLMIEQLGEQSYGIWLLALTVVSYLRLLDLGISFSGTRFLSNALGADDAKSYQDQLSSLCWIFHWIGWLTIGLTIAVSGIVPLFTEVADLAQQLRWLILGFGFTTAIKFWTAIFGVILKSHVRYDLIGVASIIRSLLQGGAVIGFLLAGHGLATLLLVFVITDILDQALLFYFTRRIAPENRITLFRSQRTAPVGPLLRYSATAMATNAGHSLRNGIDPLVVARVTTVAAVPLYSIGARFVSLFTDIINAIFGGNFLAAFSQLHGRNDPESLTRNFLISIRYCAAIASFGGAAMAIYGPDFIVRWVGPEFSDSARVLLILVPPTVLALMQYPIWGFFYSQNQQGKLALLTLLGGIFNLVLSLALAHQIGFFGVVWATLIEMTIAYGIFVPAMVCKICRISLLRYATQITNSLVKIGVASFLYWWLIRDWLAPDYLRLALLAIGHLFLIAFVFWFLVFNREERQRFLTITPFSSQRPR